MLPTDTQGRRILATERHELLRNPPPVAGPAGDVRRRLAALLVGAAERVAPAEPAARHARMSR